MNTGRPLPPTPACAQPAASAEAVHAVAAAPVVDFVLPHLRRALRSRTRYRYVRPRVRREGEHFRIEAPCCSRNIDPAGGVIDIALITPLPDGAGWQIHARDHAGGGWVPQGQSAQLGDLMQLLCTDPQRRFWP